jgi:nucleoside-diphosphate-sugar epimerase
MCYIDNVVHANISVANFFETIGGRCYNIACGDRVSNNEILAWLKNRYGKKVKIKNAPERPGDVKHTQADISKAKRQFGYDPLVRFWEGLEKTVKWWGLDE